MVGKNKMKDWKAAIRNWMRKSNENTQRANQPSTMLTDRSWAAGMVEEGS
jgi:hypothetical protein